jgi:plasmid stabilization system protein ParE
VSVARLARFTAQARSELLAQTTYYEAIRKGLGARFRLEVEASAHRAAAFPMHGKPSAGGTKRRRVADFPFSLYYTEAEYGVLVHAVAGDHQLPEYWLSRLQDAG